MPIQEEAAAQHCAFETSRGAVGFPPLRFALSCCAAALCLLLYAGAAQPQLPRFDFEKSRSLSAEEVRQYDVVFFNEIEIWNLNSNRYGADSSIKRRAEFEQMARDGYFPAYAALRLAGIWPAERRDDPEALEMLLKRADAGDASAMCAVVAIPTKKELWGARDPVEVSRKYMIAAAAKGHRACMAYYGGALLLGNLRGIPEDRAAAMPLLLTSASEGYYVAARRLFGLRYAPALRREFDFAKQGEVERALCWGRLAQQHTNWTGFDVFLGLLRDYARAAGRTDLLEASDRLDPRRVPITQQAVKPEECVRLERGQ